MRTAFFLFCFIALGPRVAAAEPLDNLAFFARCYAHLTGVALPYDHALRPGLMSGSVNPHTACKQLLDKADLPSGTYSVTDPEGLLVLRNLYEMHRTWFPTQTIDQIQAFDPIYQYAAWDVLDGTEAALTMTFNALTGDRYENVLRYNSGFIALRTENADVKARIWDRFAVSNSTIIRRTRGGPEWDKAYVSFTKGAYLFSNPDTSDIVDYPPIQVGDLTGIKPQNQSINVVNFVPGFTTTFQENARATPNVKVDYNFFESSGGGILGLQSYVLTNFGHERGLKMNGADKLPRRWIKSALESFLCADLPILRESDMLPDFLVTSTASNIPPFRNSNTCLQCHATMDQAATLGGNFFVAITDFNRPPGTLGRGGTVGVLSGYMLGKFTPTTSTAYSWSSTPVANFHLRNPTGRLYFRSMTGQLINQPVNSIAEMGTALSSTPDFYNCAAKRYLHYFTGLSVPLYDRGDPRRAAAMQAITPEEVQLRLLVEKLGAKLRDHQSLKSTLKEIIDLPIYRDRKFEISGAGT